MSLLEQKLLSYSIASDEEMMLAIEEIISAEEVKSPEKRDFDILEEAVDALLSLKGADTAALEEKLEATNESFTREIKLNAAPQRKKAVPMLRRLAPIAAIVGLLFALSAVSYAMGFNLIAITKDMYIRLIEGGVPTVTAEVTEPEAAVGTESGDTVAPNGRPTTPPAALSPLESFAYGKESVPYMLPYALEDEYEIDSIIDGGFDGYTNILIKFSRGEESGFIDIITPHASPLISDTVPIVKLYGYDTYYLSYDGLHQVEFVHEDALYLIRTTNYDDLLAAIRSLSKSK